MLGTSWGPCQKAGPENLDFGLWILELYDGSPRPSEFPPPLHKRDPVQGRGPGGEVSSRARVRVRPEKRDSENLDLGVWILELLETRQSRLTVQLIVLESVRKTDETLKMTTT